MKPRFLADADLKGAIVSGLRRLEPAVDFLSAQEALLEGLDDLTVLATAAQEGRILVSHDFGTMPKHFRDFSAQQPSPGVFLLSQDLPIRTAIDALLTIWAASDSVEWENQLTYLPL